jgi:hypothetical protein
MQVLHAGEQKLLLLELNPEFVANIAKQAGFEYRIEENVRSMSLKFLVPDREVPLLLFDAADPGNLCWFTCGRFYVDGRTLPNARRLHVLFLALVVLICWGLNFRNQNRRRSPDNK